VSGLMDAIGEFGITVVERQVLPAPKRAGSRQPDVVDDGQIDKGAAPDNAVTLDVRSAWRKLGNPRSTWGQQPPAQHLSELDQVVRGANDPDDLRSRTVDFNELSEQFKCI